MILFRRCFTKLIRFLNIYMYMPYMYLMINVIHTDVLKFIEQIFSINSVIFECIHNFIFFNKTIFLKNQYVFLYITIYYKFVYYFIIHV